MFVSACFTTRVERANLKRVDETRVEARWAVGCSNAVKTKREYSLRIHKNIRILNDMSVSWTDLLTLKKKKAAISRPSEHYCISLPMRRYATALAFCFGARRLLHRAGQVTPPHSIQSLTYIRSRTFRTMAGSDDEPPASYTTNEEDQREAAKLKERLRTKVTTGKVTAKVDPVQIAPGAHKYVLIQAENDGKTEYFVTSRKGAHYHRNAAEPLIFELEAAGYYDIEVTGGGRIDFDNVAKKIAIYGFSYSFGLANHAISREVVLEDPRYKDYEVTISNEGY